jgi:two-component system chemotaxis response regulator CheB
MRHAGQKIRVVVVDDSALIRQLLTEIIQQTADIEVVGAAADPLAARELIRNTNPDVITLDIEMPKMDGLDFLEKLMRLRPTPVVMISTLTEQGSEAAVRALELGAVDIIAKPKLDIERTLRDYAESLCQKIRDAAQTKPRQLIQATPPTITPALSTDSVLAKSRAPLMVATERLIAIGASTGGTEALKAVLMALPATSPAVLITQHMPEAFTRSFAARLDSLCRLSVKEAEHGERILPGHAYVAPGSAHLLLARSGANYVVELNQGPPVNRHRPSVDVLFRSVANTAGANAMGVILTGMGKDGAQGMLELHDAGCWTIAQDEASCVVFGMPKEAIAVGGVDEVLPLDKIGLAITARVAKMGLGNRV